MKKPEAQGNNHKPSTILTEIGATANPICTYPEFQPYFLCVGSVW